ncbi:MFS transporter [Rothia nasimurium]|uniref:MFS transporter n=1 Tax=Luteibacter anthropi TaxID=564369 RepID=A0A7X5UDP8_9GAMM|nr:MFS transporter [Luteibacter anthropi]
MPALPVNARRHAALGDGITLALSVIAFFFVMTSYYVIRPVRDQLIGAAGSSSLPVFYAILFVVMLALTPVFGWLVSRFPRRRVLGGSYVFFAVCLVAFMPAFSAQDRIGAVNLGRVFFVWVSVFNLFVVSLFWSVMADVYRSMQARLVFPFIAFGGMAGALVGPLATSLLVAKIGVPPLLLGSAFTLLLALGLLLAVSSKATANDHSGGAPIGGSILDGVKAVIARPFLRNMTLLMLLSDGVGTVAYALMADYTKTHYIDIAGRTAFYARLDLAINLFGALLQLTITPMLLRGLGAVWAMVLPSVVNFLLLVALAIHGPVDVALFGWAVSLVTIVQIGTRGMTYGMTKPASDALYTRIPRDDRYKGKNFVETTVWRLGDLLVTTGLTALRGMGATVATLGLICAGLAGVAAFVAKRAATSPDLLPENDDASS